MTEAEATQRPIIALLDSGPLGLVTHPKVNAEAQECKDWLTRFLAEGQRVLVPEIVYYELRRELRRTELKNGRPGQGLANLETFATNAGIVPITSDVIRLATEFWAEARHNHFQGAPDPALDGDMILCAQARLLEPQDWGLAEADVVIVTENVKHLTHFANAQHWRGIGTSPST